jgi:hypothetical protein
MKLVTLTIPVLATLALAACGAGGAQDAASGQPDDQAELAFARCMRANGIDLPDPGTGGGAGARRVRIGKGTAPQKLRATTESCAKKTGGGPQPLSAEQQAEFRDAALKFAQCMRRNGVDLPDPQTSSGGGGVAIQIGPGKGAGPRPDSAAFKRASEACKKLLPEPKGGRGGGFSLSARAK